MISENKKLLKKNLLLAVLVVIITIIPLLFMKNAEFLGSYDKAEKAITEIDSNYKPWFSPVWQPPSGEIESFLFALQAAIGTGIICYYFGYLKGKRKAKSEER